MYEIRITHDGLNKLRVIRGRDCRVVEEKARMQLSTWDEQWQRKLERLEKEKARRESAALKEEMDRVAAERTQAAYEVVETFRNTLAHTLSVDDTIRWDALKHTDQFDESEPRPPSPPNPGHKNFEPQISFLDRLIPGRKQKRVNAAHNKFDNALRDYEARHQYYAKVHRAWEKQRETFLAEQQKHNQALDEQKTLYEAGDSGAVEEYCDLVLSRSGYPDQFPRQYDVEYLVDPKRLVIEYQLPAVEVMPRTREVRYVKSRHAFDEKQLTDKQINEIYDDLCYQICLRTIHEVFEADYIGALSAVVFNGWVSFVAPENGKEVRSCILSIFVTKEEFLAINLAAIDPKSCFRSLKGVGSSQLHKMAAIPPVATISRDDRRFVESREVIAHLDESINLASIHWEEFEHLVRELFAQEFSADGSEVRVTQSSRDGGVDAIAFDPDPIRGGKIVIQAKRYTNVVDVSAVRDLFGTVQHEGAIKGILITTSDFGPDAYGFVKDKPITLLNGGNLLQLMEKHGHKARINLREAKELRQAQAAA